MKRYIVFNFQTYYPIGGMGDAIKICDNLENAQQFCHDQRETRYIYGDYEILDTQTGDIWIEMPNGWIIDLEHPFNRVRDEA